MVYVCVVARKSPWQLEVSGCAQVPDMAPVLGELAFFLGIVQPMTVCLHVCARMHGDILGERNYQIERRRGIKREISKAHRVPRQKCYTCELSMWPSMFLDYSEYPRLLSFQLAYYTHSYRG